MILPAVIMLSACEALFAREYYIVSEYNAGYVETIPDSEIQQVRDYTSLLSAVENLVIARENSGTVRTLNYTGDITEDVPKAINTIIRQMPLGTYAVDYIRDDIHKLLSYYEIEFTIRYSRSAAEMEQIVRIPGVTEFYEALSVSLTNFEYTMKADIASSRITEESIRNYVNNFVRRSPEIIQETPEVTVEAYPNFSSPRKIIVINFKYTAAREVLLARRMMSDWQENAAALIPLDENIQSE
jgi:hypothetical protein